MQSRHHVLLGAGLLAWIGLAHPPAALARHPEQPETAPPPGSDLSFLDHTGEWPFWCGAQLNSIFQYHPAFHADYSGPNSLRAERESALSALFTVFLAYAPFPYISLHQSYPYIEFGTNCHAVMPQDYWAVIGVSVTNMVRDMDSEWSTWQNNDSSVRLICDATDGAFDPDKVVHGRPDCAYSNRQRCRLDGAD